MVRSAPGGYPETLMSTREVPAPEREDGDEIAPARLVDPSPVGPFQVDPAAVPARDPSPGPSGILTPTSRSGGPGTRGTRNHSAARPKPPAPRPPGRSRRTILYEDQTRSGPDSPAVEVRKVRRVLRRVDTWSLFRFAIMLYACAMLVFLVAAVGLWIVATTAGAIPSIEHFITSLFALKKFHFRAGQLFLGLVGMGIVWVLAATLFTTIAGVLYNLISDVVGGIELTVLEEEPLDIVG